ncbi:O-acyltransferase like protein-like [Contarinia nasturtii]|uniref:O-acyltransferase like protein-like n=1 Tax=Contarinia nasturtii TaxID=265458 RepID=UPI0012D4BD04|nr:O-acyltransferase like protein-like [Contarinia nasturtii]
MSRAIVSRPKTGKAINIGICLPDVCSPNLMRKKVERIIGLMLKNITFEIQESTCQFEENFTHVTAADWVTIMGGEKMAKTYYPTHLRFSPWLIGICGGYILHESRKKTIRIPKLVNLLGWIISFSLMTTAIFANSPSIQLNNNKTSALNQALCESLSRVAWAIALLYIIFACVHNCGGVINWFLSNPLWQPISRLSFPIYLIHFPVVVYFHATMKSTPHISEATTYHIFFGDFVTTFILSIFAALAFELPVVELEKLIFKKQRTAPKERETN